MRVSLVKPGAYLSESYGSSFGWALNLSEGRFVDRFALLCTNGGARGPVGRGSQPVVSHGCTANEVLVGLHGRSEARIEQLGAICASRHDLGNLEARRFLELVGGDGGLYFVSACPPTMAVRRIRGRAERFIEQVQVVCETFSEPGLFGFSVAHTPHAVDPAVGGTGGTPFQLRCAGKGAIQTLVGRSGQRVDRLSAVCQPTLGYDPVRLDGPQHTLPFVGGHDGAEFVNGCRPHELMVGLAVRAGRSIDAVQPLCADAVGWDREAKTARHGTGVWSGGHDGTEHTLACPANQFVVGLNGSAGRIIDRLQLVCRDLR